MHRKRFRPTGWDTPSLPCCCKTRGARPAVAKRSSHMRLLTTANILLRLLLPLYDDHSVVPRLLHIVQDSFRFVGAAEVFSPSPAEPGTARKSKRMQAFCFRHIFRKFLNALLLRSQESMQTDVDKLILSCIQTTSSPPEHLALPFPIWNVAFPAAKRYGKRVMQSVRAHCIPRSAWQRKPRDSLQGAALHRTPNFASEALKSKLQAGNPEEGQRTPCKNGFSGYVAKRSIWQCQVLLLLEACTGALAFCSLHPDSGILPLVGH